MTSIIQVCSNFHLSLPIGGCELERRPVAFEDRPHLPCELMHLCIRGGRALRTRWLGAPGAILGQERSGVRFGVWGFGVGTSSSEGL